MIYLISLKSLLFLNLRAIVGKLGWEVNLKYLPKLFSAKIVSVFTYFLI
jgi:hypothetical protein